MFRGTGRGSCERDGIVAPYRARATRAFGFIEAVGRRQTQHHAPIDDPLALADYERATRGPRG